jgi:CDP-4-dehydro-6-deoxyglucose reductase/ferredoxin-NAD(P)+ reductase (naphthalene dioxygenase ferredoxin-specific)
MNEPIDDGKPSEVFAAHLPQAGRTIPVKPDQTLLAAALAAGVDYPHSCRSGRCGACKSRLAGGSVTLLPHTRFSLSEEEKAAGLILACRAVLETDATVMWGRGDEDAADLPAHAVASHSRVRA